MQKKQEAKKETLRLGILFAGDADVGKRAIIRKYLDDDYESVKSAEIGKSKLKVCVLHHIEEFENIYLLNFKVSREYKGKVFDLHLNTTSGYESSSGNGLHNIDRHRFGQIDVVVLCYKNKDKKSYESIKDLIEEMEIKYGEIIQFLLVETQCDTTVTVEKDDMLDKLRRKLDVKKFFKCSAKTGDNIDAIFEALMEFKPRKIPTNSLFSCFK